MFHSNQVRACAEGMEKIHTKSVPGVASGTVALRSVTARNSAVQRSTGGWGFPLSGHWTSQAGVRGLAEFVCHPHTVAALPDRIPLRFCAFQGAGAPQRCLFGSAV